MKTPAVENKNLLRVPNFAYFSDLLKLITLCLFPKLETGSQLCYINSGDKLAVGVSPFVHVWNWQVTTMLITTYCSSGCLPYSPAYAARHLPKQIGGLNSKYN